MSESSALSDPMVHCDRHGARVGAVVCRHMLTAQDRVVGFVENSDDPADLQAWCEACEALFVAEGEITPAFEAFCDAALVCCDCYQALKARHAGM